MKKSRFSDEQMVRILREADAGPFSEVAKTHGLSEETIYGWRKKFGELSATDARQMKSWEKEDARLNKPWPSAISKSMP